MSDKAMKTASEGQTANEDPLELVSIEAACERLVLSRDEWDEVLEIEEMLYRGKPQRIEFPEERSIKTSFYYYRYKISRWFRGLCQRLRSTGKHLFQMPGGGSKSGSRSSRPGLLSDGRYRPVQIDHRQPGIPTRFPQSVENNSACDKSKQEQS